MPLSYAEVIAITYNASDMAIVLTPEQQSLAVQALSVFTDSINWTDWDDYQDEIQAYVADTLNALLEQTIPPPVDTMLTIDLFCLNGEPLAGAGTLTYNASATLPFGYAMSNVNTTLFGIENDVWLRAGDYEYTGWSSLSTNGGNTEVALTDGASVIDSIISAINQAGTFGTRVKSTGTFTVPSDGYYKIVAANNGTGSGSNRQTNWTSHHIRQTA